MSLAATAAEAEAITSSKGFTQAVFPSELLYINALLSTAAGATAVTALLENTLISRTGARPPRLWLFLGYTLGTASLGLGAVNLATSKGNELLVGAGCALVAVGMLDLGLVSWSSRQVVASREPRTPPFIFGPRVFTDSTGRPAYGMGLSLTNF